MVPGRKEDVCRIIRITWDEVIQQQALQTFLAKLPRNPLKLSELHPKKISFHQKNLPNTFKKNTAWIGRFMPAILGWESEENRNTGSSKPLETFKQCYLDRNNLNSNLALPPPQTNLITCLFLVEQFLRKFNNNSHLRKLNADDLASSLKKTRQACVRVL